MKIGSAIIWMALTLIVLNVLLFIPSNLENRLISTVFGGVIGIWTGWTASKLFRLLD